MGASSLTGGFCAVMIPFENSQVQRISRSRIENVKKKVNAGLKIKEVRLEHGISQKQLAKALHVSEAYVSRVEKGKTPSLMFLDLFVCKFGLNAEEFFADVSLNGETLEGLTKRYFGPIVAILSLSAPVFPILAGAAAAGVGVTTLVCRMMDAYGAKNEKDLAKRYLNISQNTISNWKVRDKIPEKYLLKTTEDTGRSMTWLLGKKELAVRSIAEKAIVQMEEIVLTENLTLSPGKKGKIIGFLIEEFIEAGEVSQDRIREIVQLAAG